MAAKTVSKKVKSAPKELARRGLESGVDRLRGQLRDAAQQGQRDAYGGDALEDTGAEGFRRGIHGMERLLKGRKNRRRDSEGRRRRPPPPPLPRTAPQRSRPRRSRPVKPIRRGLRQRTGPGTAGTNRPQGGDSPGRPSGRPVHHPMEDGRRRGPHGPGAGYGIVHPARFAAYSPGTGQAGGKGPGPAARGASQQAGGSARLRPDSSAGCPPPAARGRALAPGRLWNIPAAFPLRGGAPASGKTGRQGRRALEQTKGPSALQGGQAGENRQTVLRFWPQRCPASPASGPGCGQGIRHAVCP